MKLLKNYRILIIIFAAFLIRIYAITSAPPALNWDEISHGYNAYSILKTGRDEWGIYLPTIFRAYGDYKLPVYIYLTSASVGVFGLNAFAVRLPSVLAGTGLVLFTYLLSKELIKSKKKNVSETVSLFAAIFVAFEPWSFFLSRPAFEANLSQFLILSGVYYFLISLNKNISKNYLILSSLLFGLSVWTYNSARVFVPFLLLSLIIIFKSELVSVSKTNKQKFIFSIFIGLLFFIPMFYQLVNPVGQARYGWVAIIDEGAVGRIIDNRLSSSYPAFLTRLMHNRPLYFISHFFQNYISHFSPIFLFLRGGSNFQFSMSGFGLLYLVQIPVLIYGIYYLLKKLKNKYNKFILIWLLLAPIPSSLTREAPHVLRSITILPIPMIISAIGLVEFVKVLETISGKLRLARMFLFIYIIGFMGLSIFYFSLYFTKYNTFFSWSWQYGYKEMVNIVEQNYDNYDKIIITKQYGEPHEFLLFYSAWNPSKYQTDENLNRFYQSNWYWVDGFDKFYFVNDWNIHMDSAAEKRFKLESGGEVDCTQSKCLLIASDKILFGWRLKDYVLFKDGQPAFSIYEN